MKEMFSKAIKIFGVKVLTVINSVATIALSVVVTKSVMVMLGEPTRPVAIWMNVFCQQVPLKTW